ncbi:MAG: prepilin-type N-terminal cleavage/methylation domain-containing protein, partial [Fusobacterium sp.]|nr:prepilin-type N-terminal cleavage/methylation domain-containing protein [Fusobacterium sp.]
GGGGSLLSRPPRQLALTGSPKASVWLPLSGFTMAEILLSLTIIGVVAAITLPSLTGNINERTWNTQRKALYARFSQAISLMPALNGYGTFDDTTDTAAETFITAGLSKVLKINNICDSDHLSDCGIPDSIITQGTSKMVISAGLNIEALNPVMIGETTSPYSVGRTISNTKAAAFETANGESILTFYNPRCTAHVDGASDYVQEKMCANFIYDLNGKKGPNTVGKDIGFITALYSTDPSVVAPMPVLHEITTKTYDQASRHCRELNPEYRLPSNDELAALFVNKKLLRPSDTHAWSSSLSASHDELSAWVLHFLTGQRATQGASHSSFGALVRCIQR